MAGIETRIPGKRLISIPFAAREKLGISPRKLWTLISEGKLKTLKVGRRSTRLLESDVDDYIEKLTDDTN
jgi:excisionase family DNA binding protein